MKKIIAVLSVVVFSLCVLSCGNDKNEKSDDNNNSRQLPLVESEGYMKMGEWAN